MALLRRRQPPRVAALAPGDARWALGGRLAARPGQAPGPAAVPPPFPPDGGVSGGGATSGRAWARVSPAAGSRAPAWLPACPARRARTAWSALPPARPARPRSTGSTGRRCRRSPRPRRRPCRSPRRAHRGSPRPGHEVVPDLGGEGPAGHGPAVVLGLHGLHLVRVADPDRHGPLLVAAGKPGVAVVLGGAGLAPGELVADLGGLAGAAGHDAREHLLGRLSDARREDALLDALALLDSLPSGAPPSSIATGPVSSGASVPDTPLAVVGDRGVGVGHLERRHALLEPAEDHRRVGGDLWCARPSRWPARPPAAA